MKTVSIVRHSLHRVLLLLLPPVVVNVTRSLRTRFTSQKENVSPEWEMKPNSDAVWTAHDGWSHQSIVETQLKKWPAFLRSIEGTRPLGQPHEAAADAPADYATHNTIMTFGYVLGRIGQGRKAISILDYVVKDLPGFCAVGASLLPQVKFVSDEAEVLCRSYDLTFASSSLHYSRDPYAQLERLCGSTLHWLMITRLPCVEQADDFVVVQRPHMYGYMTEYPGWFMNRNKVLSFVSPRGFDLVRQFLVAEQPSVPNAPEQANYYGFLFRRKTASAVS
jgi:hypothetical protein